MSNLRVAQICAVPWGGATAAAHRLQTGLRSIGVASDLLIGRGKVQPGMKRLMPKSRNLLDRIAGRLDRKHNQIPDQRAEWSVVFNTDHGEYLKFPEDQLHEYDVINLHWVAGMMNWSSWLRGLAKWGKPVVWTMHDMNAFTGGCHYDFGCGKYVEMCGSCPALRSNDPRDLSYRVMKKKNEILRKNFSIQLEIVTPNAWLKEVSEQSLLFSEASVTVIPYGIDVGMFRVKDQQEARDKMKILCAKPIVLAVADVLSNQRKGMA